MSPVRVALFAVLLAACGPATHEECVATPTIDCENTRGCTLIRARPLTLLGDDYCLRADALAENVGCMGEEIGCDDKITVAEDPNGQQWWFWNACLPEGYVDTEQVDAKPCY